ncbi:hypothetical protein EDL79_03455 [Ehrlichia ruminantium]|uniref:Uncharacterized protein n=1 Tax=Ehrlichia ruminantium TaxID=779 RepID=A0AAE6Q9D2_EHRRU|nr:hypothetical protein [Ehrlichia ruminantium]QGR02680.1 hypothetical protein EDL81_03440 [Ehrlichia ruminantium]QGR03601.1 hypothetical protein EDL80_03445 [Ehrlichia ruminantium]QGR04528.1 hypothetical protein EDL79_03455 [Ehrlichia ruminantium]
MNYDILNLYEYYGIYNDVDSVHDNELSEEYMSYQSIWKAVILQAIIDSTSNYKRMENKIEKIKANNWFNDYSQDFVNVCHFAGYSSLSVQNKAKKIISDSKFKIETK